MRGVRLNFGTRDLFRDAIYLALWLYLAYNINKSVTKLRLSNVSIAFKSMSASTMLYPSMTFCPLSNEVTAGTGLVKCLPFLNK